MTPEAIFPTVIGRAGLSSWRRLTPDRPYTSACALGWRTRPNHRAHAS